MRAHRNILLAILLSVSILVSTMFILNSWSDTKQNEIITVTVLPGDTVWSIAKEHLSQSQDPRSLVYEIGQINNLSSTTIYPGQILYVPVAKLNQLACN